MRFTPKLKPYASMVVIFSFNVITSVITNLALRDIMPSFVHVDLDNLSYFSNQTLVGFIFVNVCQFQDIKWLLFLNGPIFFIGAYFQFAFWHDDLLRKDPTASGSIFILDKMIIVIIVFSVVTFNHYMNQKDLSVLIIQKHMITQQQI
jgi:hypothetical protein